MQMPSLSRALANHPINIPPEFPAILKAYTKVGHLKGQFNEIDSFWHEYYYRKCNVLILETP
jgi:hypothetical protein